MSQENLEKKVNFLKENYDVGSNEYVIVLFSKDKGKLFQVEF